MLGLGIVQAPVASGVELGLKEQVREECQRRSFPKLVKFTPIIYQFDK